MGIRIGHNPPSLIIVDVGIIAIPLSTKNKGYNIYVTLKK